MDKFHQLISYISYIFMAKGPDRVHSPFVFNLYYYILKNRNNYYPFQKIEKHYSLLAENDSILDSNDLGAGTKHHKKKRVIGKLAKTSSIPAKWGEVLFKLSNKVKPKNSLELGTAFGKSSAYISQGYLQNKLITIDADSTIVKHAKESFKKLQIQNVKVKTTDNMDFINSLTPETKFDYIFFDANHTYQATVDYFHSLLNHVSEGAVLIFDDIYWSKEMTKAWQEICKHERATVSLDLFRLGIIFLDRDQVKEYFRLRL